MDDQQKQRIIDLPKTVAGGIAAPLAAVLTSRFGVAGTMVGLALSAVVATLTVDTLKVYLARVPGAVTSIPGGLKKKSAWGRFLVRLRLPFSKLFSLAPHWRRAFLIRSLIGGVIVFVIGLVVVTGAEASVGKNLSCWVWDDCYTESSSEGENASEASSLPSLFVAGNSISSSSAPQGSPSVPQQQPALPTPPPASSPSSSGNSSQPSGAGQLSAPTSEQQSNSSPSADYQQQSGYSQQEDYQQQSPISDSQSERQSFSSSPEEDQQPSDYFEQQSPTAPSEGADDAGGYW